MIDLSWICATRGHHEMTGYGVSLSEVVWGGVCSTCFASLEASGGPEQAKDAT